MQDAFNNSKMPLTTASCLSKSSAALDSSSKLLIPVWCGSCQSPRRFSASTFLNVATSGPMYHKAEHY